MEDSIIDWLLEVRDPIIPLLSCKIHLHLGKKKKKVIKYIKKRGL